MEKFRLSDQTGDCTNMLLGQKLNGKTFSSFFTKTHIVYSYKILKRRVVLHKAYLYWYLHLIYICINLSFATEGQEPRKEEGD